MDLTPALIAAAATLFAAAIAATVAFVVSVLAKEQKTSEFRQQWIDSLRADISEVAGELFTILTYGKMVKALIWNSSRLWRLATRTSRKRGHFSPESSFG